MSLFAILLVAYLGIGCILAYRDIDEISEAQEIMHHPVSDVWLAVTLALLAKVVFWPFFTYR